MITRRPSPVPSTFLAACLLASAFACSRPDTPEPEPEPASGEAEPPASPAEELTRPGPAEMLATMAALTGESPSPEFLLEWVSNLERGDRTLDDYIDYLLSRPRFGSEVVPTLLFGSFIGIRTYYAFPSAFTLQKTDKDVYYLREPCEPEAAESVTPWWDPASTVLVCPDSHRPDKWTLERDEHEYRSAMVLTCDSQVGSPEKESRPLCGCGPNLIRCLRDTEQYTAALQSIRDEVKKTTAHVVDNDLPISALFLMNETVRDRNVELHYRRRMIGATREKGVIPALAGLAEWPEQGQLAPRPEAAPGEHAGLLTGPQLLHFLPDRRQRQRGFYEILWCANRSSFGATTDQVLSLNDTGNLAFVHDSWQRLARTPVCTTCHARLDFGFQFLMGFPDSRASVHYVPELARTGDGPLYGESIDDPRGQGPLTPLGFARLAVAQPEFKNCMSSHFIDYVLGERATARDIARIRAEMDEHQSIKGAMGLALNLFAEHWEEDRARAPERRSLPEAAPEGADKIAVKGPLRQAIEEHCVDCHDAVPFIDSSESFGRPFDFRPAELPRPLLVRMLDHVAYGKMPKDDEDFQPEERERMVEVLIATLWADEDRRERARAYYLEQLRALPAQQIDNALDMVVYRAGANTARGDWGLYERSIYPHQAFVSPGFAATLGLEALNACRISGNRDPALMRDCLRRALHPDMFVRWPLEDPAE